MLINYFLFGIVIHLHVVVRNNTVKSCVSFTQVASIVTSCKSISQYDNQDIDTGAENTLIYWMYEVCPEGIQSCNLKNRDIYEGRYKIQETLYIGQ